MNNQDRRNLIRQALRELAVVRYNSSANPWLDLDCFISCRDEDWLDWWWRSINRIDIPTWRTLRAKVVEIRLRE